MNNLNIDIMSNILIRENISKTNVLKHIPTKEIQNYIKKYYYTYFKDSLMELFNVLNKVKKKKKKKY